MEGWKGTDFLRRTKNHYQGVKVLSGYPVIMRQFCVIRIRMADRCDYVTQKVVTLSLIFLGEGEYEAEIYEDSAKAK